MRRSLIAFCAGLLGAALLVSCGQVRAETYGLHIASVHSTSGPDAGSRWNNFNPGLYVRTSDGLQVGAYRNSNPDTPANHGHLVTGYVGRTWTRETSFGDVSVMAGAAVGYRTAPVMPMAVVSARIGHLRISAMPCVGRSLVLHASMEF